MKASSLLEPQQFGSWLHEPFLARASEPGAEHGRHALGAFLTLRLADRFRPDEEPSHPLALAYQVRATRDYLLDLHPQNAEAKHLLEIVRLANAVQKGGARAMLWPPVLAYAHWLEDELRLEEALDTVETALGLRDDSAATEEVAALLQRARVLRRLGRFEEARSSYEAGRAKASAAGDSHSELLGRIGLAIVMRQLGNLAGSERALGKILKEAEAAGDGDAQARTHHDLGLVLMLRDRTAAAVPHYYRAFELYERESDQLRALSDVGEALKRGQQYAGAEDAFMLVLNRAASAETRVCTMIALLELGALTHNRLAFARWNRDIKKLSDALPAERSVDLDLQLGLGHAAFGQRDKAWRHFKAAIERAEKLRLNEYLFQAEAALSALEAGGTREETPAWASSRVADTSEYAEVREKLRALRAG